MRRQEPKIDDVLDLVSQAERYWVDLDCIGPGENFVAADRSAATECQVLLALIGKDWINVAERGERWLDDPVDLVDLPDRRGA